MLTYAELPMDQEKTQDPRRSERYRIGHALLIGVFMGIAVFAAAKKGFGWAFFLPMVFAVLLLRGRKSQRIEK